MHYEETPAFQLWLDACASIAELHEGFREFLRRKPKPLRFVSRFDPCTHELSLATQALEPIPDALPRHAGDAVSALRRALDMAWAAHVPASLVGGGFPIYSSRPMLVLPRPADNRAETLVERTLTASQPWPGGRFGLFELDALAQHCRRAPPALRGRAVRNSLFVLQTLFADVLDSLTDWDLAYEGQGDEVLRVTVPPDHPIARNGAAEEVVGVRQDFRLAFGDGPYARQEVLPTLNGLSAYALETIILLWGIEHPGEVDWDY